MKIGIGPVVPLLLASLCFPACEGEAISSAGDGGAVGEVVGATLEPEVVEGMRDKPVVVYLGDSLAAGLGVEAEEAFPARVEHLLAERGLRVRTINAGISGDTTAGGVSRIGWLLDQDPDIVVLELGANDGLRGLSPAMTEANLRTMVLAARRAGAEVLLVGMKVPPNYGADYAERFESIFPRLAAELEVEWIPFLLEGVAAERVLNQADGIHPNAAGHRRVAETVVPTLEAMLLSIRSSPAAKSPPALPK